MVLPLVGVLVSQKRERESLLLKQNWAKGMEIMKQKNLQYLQVWSCPNKRRKKTVPTPSFPSLLLFVSSQPKRHIKKKISEEAKY